MDSTKSCIGSNFVPIWQRRLSRAIEVQACHQNAWIFVRANTVIASRCERFSYDNRLARIDSEQSNRYILNDNSINPRHRRFPISESARENERVKKNMRKNKIVHTIIDQQSPTVLNRQADGLSLGHLCIPFAHKVHASCISIFCRPLSC